MAKRNEPYVKVEEFIMKAPTVASTASTSNIGGVIVSPIGPRLAYVTSPVEFLKLYTMDGETIPRDADTTFINAYYLSYYSGLVLSRSLNTNSLCGALVYKNGDTTSITKYLVKDDSMLTKACRMEFVLPGTDVDPGDEVKLAWAFAMNDVVYYSSNMELSAVSAMPRYSNYSVFKACDSVQDIVSSLENTDNVHVYKSSFTASPSDSGILGTLKIIVQYSGSETITNNYVTDLYGVTSFTVVDRDSQDSDLVAANSAVDLPERNTWLFSIIGDIPLATNSNYIKISNYVAGDKTGGKDGSVGSSFDLEIDKSKSIYRVSLDQMKTENGVNIYIEYINTQNLGYIVTVYNNLPMDDLAIDPTAVEVASISESYGKSNYDEKESKEKSHIYEALDYLADQELYDVEYLAPFGLTDTEIARRYQLVSKEKKWFCPIDIPAEYTTYTAVKRFAETFTRNYQNMPTGIVLGPFDRNSALTGWYNDIAASTLYYERVMLNKEANAEFAPVFRSEYGKLNYNYPYKIFRKSERTDLLSLDKPINWAVYDQKDDIYYLNDNRTFQQDQDSVVCEEQNARIVWKISKDVAKIVDNFIGQYNTRTTRAAVVDSIKYYLDWNIMNKKFPPEAYMIQCDEYNNPDSLINENKLAIEIKIRLYKAIKFIEVINRVFPLGVDFNTSI